MAKPIFENFLESDEVFLACTRFWENLVRDAAASLGQEGNWQRWVIRYRADGTLIGEKWNPIYDERSRKLDRAFEIIQHPGDAHDLVISAWVRAYDPAEWAADMPREELVIDLILSEESAELASGLLRKWMRPETSTSEMESFIHQLLSQRGTN